MVGAARRVAVIVAVVFGLTACVSALLGLLSGTSVARAVSLGFYLVGCFLLLLGVVSGIRGPLRSKDRPEDIRPVEGLFGVGIFRSGVRTATGDERTDARAAAWLFMLLGAALVLGGVLVDSRVGVL